MSAKAVLEHPQGQVRVCETRVGSGSGNGGSSSRSSSSDVGGGDKTHSNRRYVQHKICTYL